MLCKEKSVIFGDRVLLSTGRDANTCSAELEHNYNQGSFSGAGIKKGEGDASATGAESYLKQIALTPLDVERKTVNGKSN